MRCAHVQVGAEGAGSLCGKQTEFVCWHCHAPRCVNHVLLIDGEVLCLAAGRAKLGFRHSDHARRGCCPAPGMVVPSRPPKRDLGTPRLG
jgi:hypothetical protein